MTNYPHIELVFKYGIVHPLGGGHLRIYIHAKGDSSGFGLRLRIGWNLPDFTVGPNDNVLIVGGPVKAGVYPKDGPGFLLVFAEIFVDRVSHTRFQVVDKQH